MEVPRVRREAPGDRGPHRLVRPEVRGLHPELPGQRARGGRRALAELRAGEAAQAQPQRTGGRTIFASSDDDGSAAEPEAEPSQRGDRRYHGRAWTPLLTIPPAARLVSIPDDGGFVRLAD